MTYTETMLSISHKKLFNIREIFLFIILEKIFGSIEIIEIGR